MKFESNEIFTNPPILKRKLGGELFVPVTLASTAFSNGVCKAGTPITSTGTKAVTSGGSNNAKGILLNDVFDDNPNGSLIVAYASVNASQGASHSGVTYDTTLINTLSNITFE